MKFYLVRHALAMEREDFQKESSKGDFYRPLTPRGRRRFQRILKRLKNKNVPIKHLYSSPYLRCMQTAKMLAETLGVKKVRPLKALAHQNSLGTSSKKFLRELKTLRKYSYFVGHEPELSQLMADLKLPKKDLVKFKKGEVRCLEKIGSTYKVLWSLKPSRKRRIPE